LGPYFFGFFLWVFGVFGGEKDAGVFSDFSKDPSLAAAFENREDAEGEGGRGEIILTTEAQSTRRVAGVLSDFSKDPRSRLLLKTGRTQREKEGTEKSYSPQRHRVHGGFGTLFFGFFLWVLDVFGGGKRCRCF
jgi:hypothetical protein